MCGFGTRHDNYRIIALYCEIFMKELSAYHHSEQGLLLRPSTEDILAFADILHGIPYRYDMGPRSIADRIGLSSGEPITLDRIKESGVPIEGFNCQTLGHLFLNQFGAYVPSTLMSSELYVNTDGLFEPIDDEKNFLPLDIALRGRFDADPKTYHWTIATGSTNDIGDPLFVHYNMIDRTVSTWSEGEFTFVRRYPALVAVRRHKAFACS